jgi:CII-binding regulator of phage lambda lysogenization HflD
MEEFNKQLQKGLNELQEKLGNSQEASDEELKTLLLARLMDEELNEERSK